MKNISGLVYEAIKVLQSADKEYAMSTYKDDSIRLWIKVSDKKILIERKDK